MDSEETISVQGTELSGRLIIPDRPKGAIIFAHGSGSNISSARNNYVASKLNEAGYVTLVFDLLTAKEQQVTKNRFDIELLSDRLVGATKWLRSNKLIKNLKVGYFGSSTGAAAALSAAAYWGPSIRAVVSRGGRPDLAEEVLDLIETPVLLIVGGEDREVLSLNRQAYSHMGCEKKMEIVSGATHLFEEEGAMERVANLSTEWFDSHMEDSQ